MIEFINWREKALEKLEAEQKAVTGQKEKIMATAVLAAVKTFCEQEQEFAQAVVQGGSFAECMKKVASGVGNSISDIDAYKKAVQFYFPGAQIRMQMSIDLIGKAAGKKAEKKSAPKPLAEPVAVPKSTMILSLEDFLD